MKILITGNMGYIGPTLTKHLHAAYPDASLMGFDIGYFGNCVTGAKMLPECRVDVQYFGDMRKFPAAMLAGVDAVVHLAGESIAGRFSRLDGLHQCRRIGRVESGGNRVFDSPENEEFGHQQNSGCANGTASTPYRQGQNQYPHDQRTG